MAKVTATITTSVDGYVTGPDDGPGCGLGIGGERLHSWVFGGPWSYESPERGQPVPADQAWMRDSMVHTGAVIAGRATYEAADHWGDTNPWGLPLFILTHRPEEQPVGDDFIFVSGVAEALQRAQAAAGDKDVNVMGGAATIRQCLAAGVVDELAVIIAPLVLGGGKRLFDGFTHTVELEHIGARQSRWATFVDYRVRNETLRPKT